VGPPCHQRVTAPHQTDGVAGYRCTADEHPRTHHARYRYELTSTALPAVVTAQWCGHRRKVTTVLPCRASTHGVRGLAGRRVEPVPDVDRADRDQQRRQVLLVVVFGGRVPHVVRHRVRTVGEPCHALREFQRGTFGIG